MTHREENQRGTIELLVAAALLLTFLAVSRISDELLSSSQLSSQMIHSLQLQERERGKAIQQLPHQQAAINHDQILCQMTSHERSESLCSFSRANPQQQLLFDIEPHFQGLTDCPFDTTTVIPDIRRRSVHLCMRNLLPAATSVRYRGDMQHDTLEIGTADHTTELIITGSLSIRELKITGNVIIASLGDTVIETLTATAANPLIATLLNPAGKLTVQRISSTVTTRYYSRSLGTENHQLQLLTPDQNPWPLRTLVIGMHARGL